MDKDNLWIEHFDWSYIAPSGCQGRAKWAGVRAEAWLRRREERRCREQRAGGCL